MYHWNPQPDITAYELALCAPLLPCTMLSDNQRAHLEVGIAYLPPTCQRHWRWHPAGQGNGDAPWTDSQACWEEARNQLRRLVQQQEDYETRKNPRSGS